MWWSNFYNTGTGVTRAVSQYAVKYINEQPLNINYVKKKKFNITYLEKKSIKLKYIDPEENPVKYMNKKNIKVNGN